MPKARKLIGSFSKQQQNRAAKSRIKSALAEVNQAVSEKDANSANEALRKAIRILDKAASKGVIHPNAAARRKSRLTRKVSSVSS